MVAHYDPLCSSTNELNCQEYQKPTSVKRGEVIVMMMMMVVRENE